MKFKLLIAIAAVGVSSQAFAMVPSAVQQQASEVIIPPSSTPATFHTRPNEWTIPPAVAKSPVKPNEWTIPPAVEKAPVKPNEWTIPPALAKTVK